MKMKILFAGDASNLHNTLAHQLRQMGHEAVVVSDGSRWMRTGCDIRLERKPGRWGAMKYVADILCHLPRMRGYDVVQLAGSIFFSLRPERLRYIFDYLRRHNGRVVYSALGTDVTYYDACHNGHTYRYSDYRLGDKPSPYVGSDEYRAQEQDNWRQPFMRHYHNHLLDHIDGATAALWEYDAAYRTIGFKPLAYIGIPIDTDALHFQPLEHEPEKVRFFLGLQSDRTVIKGTDKLLEALRRVHDRYPTLCEMDVVERLPYDEYVTRMSRAHVILDQIYSYTPATNALLGMAQGLIAVSGAEPEYYDFIGERDNRPIVNIDPTAEGDIDAKLEQIIKQKAQLPEWGRHSREFIEKHNAAPVVAQRYVDFLQSLA